MGPQNQMALFLLKTCISYMPWFTIVLKYKNEMKQLPPLNNRKSFKPIIYNKTGNKSNNQYNITKHEYE